MLPVEAKPLLAEEYSSAANTSTVRSLSFSISTSGKRGNRENSRSPSTRITINHRENADTNAVEQTSSYTDLISLAKEVSMDEAVTGMSGKTQESSRNELGTINGVYVPCLLNIIGVILFLRLGWGVGQAGVEGMLLIFFMAELQAVLTVLSASTIASNGAMQGGGSYFLISRSLGPEFGGAIGLQFYFLYAVGVAMYLVGFAEEAQHTWFPHPSIGERMVVVIIATIALLVIVGIALIGAHAFAKVNKYLFVLQFATVAIGALFIYVLTPHTLKNGGTFVGVNMKTLSDNIKPHFSSEQGTCGDVRCSLAGVYAVVFPLATGFMEGLNLSGDLKDPGRSIPVGTLSAVATSCVVYIFLIFTFAAAFTGSTLRNNFTFFQEVSSFPFIVIGGVLVSCFSSGLGSLFGASRILQAIARDDLFPMLASMSQGSARGDEPQHAVLMTALITQVFICIGDLDVIAPICTSFFCLAYAGVNLTCFLLQVTGVPNFRPSFRYHSWHLSLLGAVLNIAVMIYLNALYAAVSLIVLACLFLYVYMTSTPKNWGDISQALIYHQVRKYLLRLDTRKAHAKFWRPSILLFSNTIDAPEVELCHHLKKGGLYVVGHVITGDFSLKNNDKCGKLHNQWLGKIFDTKMKVIPQVVVATHSREGYRMLLQTSGLGGMQINTVVIPWPTGWDGSTKTDNSNLLNLYSPTEFVGLLVDGILIKKNVIVLRNSSRLDPRLLGGSKGSKQKHIPLKGATDEQLEAAMENIDVWITSIWDTPGSSSSAALMLQLAYVLHSNKKWHRRTRIRLIKACRTSSPTIMQQERLRLERIATDLRLDMYVNEVLVISTNSSSILSESTSMTIMSGGERDRNSVLAIASSYLDTDAILLELNQTIQRHATRTAQIILMLPDARLVTTTSDGSGCRDYLTKLEMLTNNLPSTMLVFSDDEPEQVVSTSI